jgi:hypothetical protein
MAYAPAALERFGFRDDYPILVEAQQQPAKIVAVCGAQGRFLYGVLLQLAGRVAGNIDGLVWVRLASAAGLGLLAVSVLLLLVRSGWALGFAAPLAVLLVSLPSAQVLTTWVVCAPQIPALLLAVGAFALGERGGLTQRGRWLAKTGSALLTAAAAVIYPPQALFSLVLVAGALVVRRKETFRQSLRYLGSQLGALAVGLVLAYVSIQASFAAGLFHRSPRVRFETDWWGKAVWLVTDLLPHALALQVIDQRPGSHPGGYFLAIAAVPLVCGVGLILEGRRAGRGSLARWLVGMVLLSLAACAVSAVTPERLTSYRILYALAGVWCVFAVASLANVAASLPRPVGRLLGAGAWALALGSAALAGDQALRLIAVPQNQELALMDEGAREAARVPSHVFVVVGRQDEGWTPQRFGDEFGSVSIDADWLAKAVLQLLMKEHYPSDLRAEQRYQFRAGLQAPQDGGYDVLIDLRAKQVIQHGAPGSAPLPVSQSTGSTPKRPVVAPVQRAF